MLSDKTIFMLYYLVNDSSSHHLRSLLPQWSTLEVAKLMLACGKEFIHQLGESGSFICSWSSNSSGIFCTLHYKLLVF